MEIVATAKRKESDVLILPFWKGEKGVEEAFSNKDLKSLYAHVLTTADFRAKEGESLFIYPEKGKERRLLLLGLGKKKEIKEESLRRAYAAATRACQGKKLKEVSVLLPKTPFSCAALIAEGMLLANYSFDQLKKDVLKENPVGFINKLYLIEGSEKEWAEVKRVEKIVGAVNFARDLVNGNADDVTPQMLAETAKSLEKISSHVKTTVFDKKRIEKEKMGLLLAVNRGSFRDPAFILIEYRGDPSTSEMTALVGKGITYDTGGLNLKPTGSMETMKDDMSGAAAVLGTIKAAAELKLKVNLLGAIPSTENAIGGKSYKPGDVYRSHAGKMVEISNTDAEGRLVLADALSYVQEHYKLSKIIDLATLTGGIVIALGEETTGLFCNDDKLAKNLEKAGEKTYERVWRMPMFSEYKEALKSTIADIKNSADRKASAINGAVFLLEFIKKVPWAHLDIAGTAFISHPKHYHPTSATGVGVRLLIEYLTAYEL